MLYFVPLALGLLHFFLGYLFMELELCTGLRGREGLRDLYLLTVADLSTTSPTAMTSWKARMLDELYFAAEAHLASPGQQPRADAERVARVRSAVLGELHGDLPGPARPVDVYHDQL